MVLQRQYLLKKNILINSHDEPLWYRSRFSRSLDIWTGWFLDSLVLECFLDSLLVLFPYPFYLYSPSLGSSSLYFHFLLFTPMTSFVFSLLPTPAWAQTIFSPSSPDFYLQRRPVYCAYPDRWNCWLSVSKADSLKSLHLLAESVGFAIFPREPFPHILPWIRLIEPLSFQATHTGMPSVPSVCPGQFSSMYLEAFSPSQIHFAYQQLVNLPEALWFSP